MRAAAHAKHVRHRQTGEAVTETQATPGEARESRGISPKLVLWVLVLAMAGLALMLVRGSGVELDGDQWAKYRSIRTPDVVRTANQDSISQITRSLQGVTGAVTTASQTMVEDAGGNRIGGGEAARETRSSATAIFPRWPVVASVEAYGWGTPSGPYRLDVEMYSPASLIKYSNPTVARGATVNDVANNRERIAALFEEVLSASRLEDVYNAQELAASAHVGHSWMGDGVVSVAALLPPTPRVDRRGSLTVDVGRDWQIESFSVWTDDTFAYEDAVNPRPPLEDPLAPPEISPEIMIEQ